MQLTQGTPRILRDCGGRGTLGCLFTMILAGAALLAAVQAGPPYIAYSNLKGDVGTEVSRAGAHSYTDEILAQNILDAAKKDEVNLTRENIRVEHSPGKVDVVIDYSVPVNFVFAHHTFEFEIRASSLVGAL
jgi:hypothetical protein